jgi:hypothetical protein
MTDERVVPDPKSGRDSSPQNPNAVEQYIAEMDIQQRKNELKQVHTNLSRIRAAMNELQDSASRHRRKYEFVPEDLRRGLKSARQAHRDLTRIGSILKYSVRSEEE